MRIGKLTATTSGQTTRFELHAGQTLTLGRGSHCAIQVRDSKVSREHCQLRLVDGRLLVTDLGSSHGLTYLGEQCSEFSIEAGDGFHVGTTFVRFEFEALGERLGDERPAVLPATQRADGQTARLPAEPAVGTELNGYLLESVLGRSERCTVYRAEQVKGQRKVAVKLLRRNQDGVHATHERSLFLKDLGTAAAFADPRLVPVLHIEQSGQECFAAMELVEGESLAARLERGERMRWQDLLPLLADVLSALEVVHAQGRVHGGVKPSNVFAPHEGGARLADPRYTPRPRPAEAFGYSAPEQLLGHEVDGRADLFGLGCVAYAALAGRQPFAGQEQQDADTRLRPPGLRTIDAAIPPGVEHFLCDRLLAWSAADRPDTASQARAELLDPRILSTRSDAVTTPAAIPIPMPRQASVDRPEPRRRSASPAKTFAARLTAELIVFSITMAVGIAILVLLKKIADVDIYRLLDVFGMR